MSQACTSTTMARAPAATVQWNDPLDAVLARMDATSGDDVLVLQGDRLVGRIRRADLERLHRCGNAACSIAALDAMERLVAGGGS